MHQRIFEDIRDSVFEEALRPAGDADGKPAFLGRQARPERLVGHSAVFGGDSGKRKNFRSLAFKTHSERRAQRVVYGFDTRRYRGLPRSRPFKRFPVVAAIP